MTQRHENISHGVLLMGLATLALTGNWWPGLLFVLGIYFSLRNLLSKQYLRMVTTLVIYTAVFICVEYSYLFSRSYVLPIILFTMGVERVLGGFLGSRKTT